MNLPPLGIAVAALGGMAIGIEREWSGHTVGPDARFGGIRTFTLLGLLAGTSGWLVTAGWTVLAAALLGCERAPGFHATDITGASFGTGSTTFTTTNPGYWSLGADNYFGFRFTAADGSVHYGWGRMTMGSTQAIRTLVEVACAATRALFEVRELTELD